MLSIRVRYWYEMRIPFANWVIFISWFAANADVALHGAIDRSTLCGPANMMNQTADVAALARRARASSHQKGYATVYPARWRCSGGWPPAQIPLVARLDGQRYFIPLTATYSMRMQSNFHRKWMMHRTRRGGCGC